MGFRKNKYKKADAILEYGIILFVVILAVVAMYHEVRRSIQGAVKAVVDKTPDEGGIGKQGENLEPGGTGERKVNYSSSQTENENEGMMSYTSLNNDDWTYSADVGTVDVVDFSRRPLETGSSSNELDYPDAEYWRWEKTVLSYPLQ